MSSGGAAKGSAGHACRNLEPVISDAVFVITQRPKVAGPPLPETAASWKRSADELGPLVRPLWRTANGG
jgi:hypothetical protein